MPNLGPTELIILLVIVLLLFGAKRIPELARGLGTGMREFKKGTKGEYDEVEGRKKDEEELSAGGGAEEDAETETSERTEQRQR
jgi:sec-independent protein translocase protein TatA